jgi:hypothetical protein
MHDHDPDTQSNAASVDRTVQSNSQLTDGSPTLHAVCPDCADFEALFDDDIRAHVAAAEHELDTGHDPTVRRVETDGGQPGPDPVAERGYLAAVADRAAPEAGADRPTALDEREADLDHLVVEREPGPPTATIYRADGDVADWRVTIPDAGPTDGLALVGTTRTHALAWAEALEDAFDAAHLRDLVTGAVTLGEGERRE